MIELLPTGDPDDLATRADVGRVGERIDRLGERMDRFDERMDRLEQRMEKQFDRLDERIHEFHGALRDQTRNFILATTGSMLTVGAMAFAAATII